MPSDAWCLTFSFSHPFVFIFLLTFLYLLFPFLPTGTVTLCFSNHGFVIFSLHPFIQTNSAVHTMRWRPGAQWWLSCMALSHVLNPAWHSGEDQGWRSIFCPATEQWWRRIETKWSRSKRRMHLRNKGFVGKNTPIINSWSWILIFRWRKETLDLVHDETTKNCFLISVADWFKHLALT